MPERQPQWLPCRVQQLCHQAGAGWVEMDVPDPGDPAGREIRTRRAIVEDGGQARLLGGELSHRLHPERGLQLVDRPSRQSHRWAVGV